VTEPTAKTMEENRAAQTMRQNNIKNKTEHSQNHKLGMQAGNGRCAKQLIKNETFEHYAGEQRDEMGISRTKENSDLS
jgi:undecaprenyl pyrophosphate synthase